MVIVHPKTQSVRADLWRLTWTLLVVTPAVGVVIVVCANAHVSARHPKPSIHTSEPSPAITNGLLNDESKQRTRCRYNGIARVRVALVEKGFAPASNFRRGVRFKVRRQKSCERLPIHELGHLVQAMYMQHLGTDPERHRETQKHRRARTHTHTQGDTQRSNTH